MAMDRLTLLGKLMLVCKITLLGKRTQFYGKILLGKLMATLTKCVPANTHVCASLQDCACVQYMCKITEMRRLTKPKDV